MKTALLILVTILVLFILYTNSQEHFLKFDNINNEEVILNAEASIHESVRELLTNVSTKIDVPQNKKSGDMITKLYDSKPGGKVWYANWSNNINQKLLSGESDSTDSQFVIRGDGTATINGKGVLTFEGEAPRMYVLDPKRNDKWSDVEVTVYAKRVSETSLISSQGIVIGARSEHQDASGNNPCAGPTYYGRLLYDGRAVFQKEIIHEGAYSENKPAESNKAIWNTSDGTMPKNVWIGVKFIVRNTDDDKSVKLELYRDLTNGLHGGTWEKVAEYTDNGNWPKTVANSTTEKTCGFEANKVLIDPGTSIFIRNDNVKKVQYKLFSIREIE